MPAYANSPIFFAAGDVVFARPSDELNSAPPGALVRIHRRAGNGRTIEVGTGEIFRSRAEHIAITVLHGTPAQGDIVSLDESTAGFERLPPRDAPTLPAEDASPRRALLYPLFDAPSVVSARFNTGFIKALELGPVLDERSPGSQERSLAIIPARSVSARPDTAEMIAAVAKAGAEYAILPVYFRDRTPDKDLISVYIIDGKTGNVIGMISQEAVAFPKMEYTAIGKRVGGLEIVGRFSGLDPHPDAAAIGDDGSILISVAGDVFRLESAQTRHLFGVPDINRNRLASISTSAGVYSVLIEDLDDGQRVVFAEDGEPAFVSRNYPEVTSVASDGNRLVVLRGDTLEIIKWVGFGVEPQRLTAR